ncbi:hypothetical protein ELE36_02545 [Pseudolysobacter antarcticus]|uniref:Uncharacterized protein n=1 Tax=Pseudolysobacter antarcticus TaxID=2511995 RepID=A0A411HFT0_9GAMM|nr:hypothetical protein [Pseudolysobacter antarcticus]QBB69342.1 hypothetical protein ELE36_02545 [Pseudolysobacter antarcticus]
MKRSFLNRKVVAILTSITLCLAVVLLIGDHEEMEPPKIFTVVSSTALDGALGSATPHAFDIFVTVSPNPVLEDEDAQVSVRIKDVASPVPGARVAVRLEDGGLSVSSHEARLIDLKQGETTLFVVSPKGKGRKSFHVLAEYVAPANGGGSQEPVGQRRLEKLIELTVQEQPTIWMLSNKALASTGFWGQALGWSAPIFLTYWLTRRGTARRRRPH